MQSIPLHIAYLLTQHDCVIVPGLGAFVVSPFDKEKANRWGIIAPPINSLDFNPEIKQDDGLLANSIEEERKCSYIEASRLINNYVTQALDSLSKRKSAHIPWVGTLYGKGDKILFQPDKTLSCNAINYGLTGFSLPFVKDMKRTTANYSKPKNPTNYLRQDNFTPPKQNPTTYLRQDNFTPPKQSSIAVLPEQNKNNITTFLQSWKFIISICSVVAVIVLLMILMKSNNDYSKYFKSKKNINIIRVAPQNLINDETEVPKIEIQTPVEPTIKSSEENIEKDNEVSVDIPTGTQINYPISTNQNSATPLYYYIIVGSWPTEIYAKNAQSEFHSKGFYDAGILYNNKQYRIYTNRFENMEDAESFLIQFREDFPMYESAWILKQ